MGIAAFWNLLGQSQLLPTDQVQQLSGTFQAEHPSVAEEEVDRLVKWLVARQALTAYQSAVLKAGRSGPFHYGDYRVYDRLKTVPRQGTFRAVHLPSGFPVLLKFASAQQAAANWPELAARIDRQSQRVHPSLVRCYEPVDLVQFRFAVMSGFGTRTLAEEIAQKKRLSAAQACELVWRTAQALQAMHQAGESHGDVRAATLLLDEGGNVRLWRDPLQTPSTLYSAQQGNAEELVERARYMAPELAVQTKSFDALTDIYALGCVFYEMLSGRPPFAAADVMSLMQAHATQPIASLEEWGVPAPVAQMVAYMMAKKPELRYQEMGIVVDQLRAFVAEAKQTAPLPDPAEDRFVNWIHQKRQSVATQAAAPEFPQVQTAPVTVPVAATDVGPTVTPPIDVGDSPSAPRPVAPYIRRRKSPIKLIAIATTGLLFLGGAFAVWAVVGNRGDSDAQTSQSSDNSATSPGTEDGDTDSQVTTTGNQSSAQQLVDDDRRTLWETPTLGAPIDLSYVASGVRMLIHLRPAELFAGEEGQLLKRAMGPDWTDTADQLEQRFGVRWDEIDRVLIGFHDNAGQAPQPSFRISLRQGVDWDTLLQRWGSPDSLAVENSANKIWASPDGWGYLPIELKDNVCQQFLIGRRDDVAAVALSDGAPPLIRRELRALLVSSDHTRHLSILVIPHSLFNDEGRKLFQGVLAKLVDPLEWLIGDAVGAALVSAHWDDDLYLEVMLKPQLDLEPQLLAEQFESRIRQMLTDLSGYVFGLGSNPYWDRLRMRFDNWMTLAQGHTRYGVENNIVVANCWLPRSAAPNLAVAGELALASAPGQSYQAVAPSQPTIPQDIQSLLASPLTIEIPRNDLVLIVEEIKQTIRDKYPGLEFPMDIKLMGKDLELGQITQNQSVSDFSMTDQPLAAILTELMVKANPDSSTTGPSDPKTKMVWVVAADPDSPTDQIILITTRDAASDKSYELPPEFRLPNSED